MLCNQIFILWIFYLRSVVEAMDIYQCSIKPNFESSNELFACIALSYPFWPNKLPPMVATEQVCSVPAPCAQVGYYPVDRYPGQTL